jgi:hypothetical protein
MNACPTRHRLDCFEARTLPDEGGEVARHVEGCARCRGALDGARAAFEPLWRDRARILAEVEARRASTERRWSAPRRAAPLAAAAALALMFVEGGPERAAEQLTAKGGAPALEVFRERQGHVARVANGDALREGDRLVFRVRSSSPLQVAVVGIEATGSTFAYAARDGRSFPVTAGLVELPVAARLDGSSGDESIILVACPTSFAVDGANLPSAACVRDVLHVRKEAP